MEMEIEQRTWAIGAKFDITTPTTHYTASRGLFTLLAGFQLVDRQGQVAAQIGKQFSFLKPQYTISLAGGTVYSLAKQSIVTGTYICEGNGERYAVYAHRGRSFSIFRNEQQVASFAHQAVTVMGGNVINIRADDNCNVELTISIVLCIEAPQDQGNRQAVSFDFGKIGPEERPIDPNWEPRRSR
jgi:uncharacterized protein YxjI